MKQTLHTFPFSHLITHKQYKNVIHNVTMDVYPNSKQNGEFLHSMKLTLDHLIIMLYKFSNLYLKEFLIRGYFLKLLGDRLLERTLIL